MKLAIAVSQYVVVKYEKNQEDRVSPVKRERAFGLDSSKFQLVEERMTTRLKSQLLLLPISVNIGFSTLAGLVLLLIRLL